MSSMAGAEVTRLISRCPPFSSLEPSSQGSGLEASRTSFVQHRKTEGTWIPETLFAVNPTMSRRPALSSASNVGRPSARSASMDTIDFHIPQIINVRPTRHHATSSIVAQRSMSPDGYGTRPYSTDDESVDDSDASSGAGIIKVRNDDVDAIIAKVREYMETLDPDCVDSGNKGPARRDQLPEGVSAVLDPTNGQSLKNVTIELEMPVRDDLEEPIEEFSRLWRLGRFKDAEHYFAANLADHIHNESVRIPYGEMLLARGDYGAFARTREKEALGYASWGGSQHSEGKPFPFLQLLWGFRDLTKIFDYSDNRLFGSMDGRLTSIHDLDDKFAEVGWVSDAARDQY